MSGKTASKARRIFFLDIENYAGRPVLDAISVRSARNSILGQFGLGANDMVVIGTSHTSNCVVAGLEWEGARQVFQRGKDGADKALLKALGQYRLDTFDEVFVMSGDGVFSDAVSRLASDGIRVRVVSCGERLSKSLIGKAPCLIAA